MGGNTAPLVARLGGGLEDPVLRDLLAGATGELRVSLDVSGAAPCVLLLSACSDPDRLGRLIERAVPAGAAPVLEGESNGIGWAAARAGNRVLLGFGDQPLQAATSALRRIQQPAEDAPGKEEAEAGGPVAVRVELSVSAILSLLRGSAARGGSDPAATPMAPLRIDLWPAGKALRFELIATHASLTDSVPSLELR
jgi:hypothetical protein